MICVQTKEVKTRTANNKYLPIIRKIPDELWDEFKKILPTEKPAKTVGRPIVPYRKVLDSILYVLRTGCQWKMLPNQYGSGSVCHRRFQEWNKLDVFKNAWIKLLGVYDKKSGYQLDLAIYRLHIYKVVFRGAKTGNNPTDRSKSGTKRHILTEKMGIPYLL
jgi:putative transposase